ncbi:uncharacterized protein LOC119992630 isoform X1 [Tripterygium wilfordii]|uniref:uncharacterized protein LOC119992630 isoform X1 n=1 Tax=Tripterygium wilfordii TaxID=458696 RepID=UPI0018F81E74|nr:uncharacterized protein LOC119992630 isoform X1 [Tripterygium wilfordii]
MTSGCCFSSEESLFEVFHEMRLEWLVGSRLASTESETASGEGCMDCVCSKCRSQGKSIGEHLAAMDLRTGSLLGGFCKCSFPFVLLVLACGILFVFVDQFKNIELSCYKHS